MAPANGHRTVKAASDFGAPLTMSIHGPEVCEGEPCAWHHPSDHPMRDWPRILRESTLTERCCPHGVGHPDPDSVAWLDRIVSGSFRKCLSHCKSSSGANCTSSPNNHLVYGSTSIITIF